MKLNENEWVSKPIVAWISKIASTTHIIIEKQSFIHKRLKVASISKTPTHLVIVITFNYHLPPKAREIHLIKEKGKEKIIILNRKTNIKNV